MLDKLLFYPSIPKRGGKRLRKKKAKAMRLHYVGAMLRDAGLSRVDVQYTRRPEDTQEEYHYTTA